MSTIVMQPHYDQRPQQESFGQMAGRSLGQGVGQGLTAGINRALEDMYEEKAYQKQAARQKEQNREQIKGLAPYLQEVGLSKRALDSLYESGAGVEMIPHILRAEQQRKQQELEYGSSQNLADIMRGLGGVPGQTQPGQMPERMQMQQPESQYAPGNNPFQQDYNPNQAQVNPIIAKIAGLPSQQQGMQQEQVGQEPAMASGQMSDAQFARAIQQLPPKKQKEAINFRQRQQELALKQSREAREDRKEIAERYKPTIEKINKEADVARGILPGMEVAVENLKDMKTGAMTWDNIVKTIGGSAALPFMSAKGQILEQSKVPFFENFREAMGGALTDSKIAILEDKLSSVGKDPVANSLAVYLPYLNNKLKLISQNESEKIISKNKDAIPGNFHSQLEKKLKPYRDDINKDLNDILAGKQPKSEFSKTEIGKHGKTLDPKNSKDKSIMQDIFNEANGDADVALKIAKQRGYKF